MPAGPAGCRLVPACLGTLRPLWQDLFWGCVGGVASALGRLQLRLSAYPATSNLGAWL
jgi:hypothetical protein